MVAGVAQLPHCPFPSDDIIVACLVEQLLDALFVGPLLQDPVSLIKAHKERLVGTLKDEAVVLVLQPHGLHPSSRLRDDSDLHGHPVDGYAMGAILDLCYGQADLSGRSIPTGTHFRDGMARREYELLEEPVHVPAGNLVHGLHEVVGVDWLESVIVQERAEGPEEGFITEQEPKLVQDSGALRVGMRVEVVVRSLVPVEYDRTHVARVGFPQVCVLLARQRPGTFLVATLMPSPEVVAVGSKALIQPGM